ncbi:hypothetical protein Trisim1_006648 [Trichoderma cf. simile WF8]
MAEFTRDVQVNIPPLRLKVALVKQYLIQKHGRTAGKATQHSQYANGVAAVKAYHKQAANMNAREQREYIDNIAKGWFFVEPSAETKPSNHRAHRNDPYSWPNWVLLNALCPGNVGQHRERAERIFGDYTISDFTAIYRQHHPRRGQAVAQAAQAVVPVAAFWPHNIGRYSERQEQRQ